MQEVIGQINRLRQRTLTALVAQRGAVIASFVLGALIVLIGLDYLLRLPSLLRLALEAGGAAALIVAVARYLAPAISFRPSLTQVALRVEETLPALRGRLASSIEFAAAGVDRTNPLAARSVHDTVTRLSGARIGAALRTDRAWRSVLILCLIAASAAGLGFTNPAAVRTGLARVLWPYGAARWPARTGVQSLMDQVVAPGGVHPRGAALALRAQVTRGPQAQRVFAHYRLHADGRPGAWSQIVLTHQGAGVHERLIDTGADAVEVYFTTADDASQREHFRLEPPPAVARATLSVLPPDYAGSRLAPRQHDMGPGIDHRSAVDDPILVGSRATMEIVLNKPLPVPLEDGVRDTWLRDTLAWPGQSLPRFSADPARPEAWTLEWRIQDSTTMTLELVDEHGLRNTEPISYRIDAVADRLPVVTLIEPATDLPVLPGALVALSAEGQDDVAIAQIGLRARVERSRAAPAGAEESWEVLKDADAAAAGAAQELDLAPFHLAEGDAVLLYGLARDIHEQDGAGRELVASPPRRLRVINEVDFISQLRRQLGAVRQNAIRIEAMQGELQEDVIDDGPEPGTERAQAQIAERLADQRQAVDDIGGLLKSNRLQEPQLLDLLQQSSDLLDFAGRAANQASQAIESRQRGRPAPPRAPESPDEAGLRRSAPEDQPIVEAQQEVREELADLIELLDRDEDTWVVTRQMEALREEQARLQGRTGELDQRTMGRERSELPAEDTSELDQIASAQQALAEEARKLVEELRERSEAMERIDPEAAGGMRSAAETAEERELDRDMERAGQRAEANQLQNARDAQQQALDTLQRMMDEVEQSKRARAEQLLRRLASLIESVQRLISLQENELAALDAARDAADYAGRDRAMIRLNQNTQVVAAEARGAGQQARRIARSLDRAADAQGSAVTALRAEPLEHGRVEEAEARSLELLHEALKLAQELEGQTQEEQVRKRREELIESYRRFAEQQVEIRGDTLKLAEHPVLERRELVEARRLATAQDELAAGLDELRRANDELSSQEIFALVHRSMDQWSRTAAEGLRQGQVGVDVTDRQDQVAAAIGRLIQALQESTQPPPEFAGDSQGQQGGSGQQPLIPPASQLRLLHGVQEEIYVRTGEIDRRRDLGEAQRRQRLRDLGEQQRELMRIAEAMVERLKQQGPPGAAEKEEP